MTQYSSKVKWGGDAGGGGKGDNRAADSPEIAAQKSVFD